MAGAGRRKFIVVHPPSGHLAVVALRAALAAGCLSGGALAVGAEGGRQLAAEVGPDGETRVRPRARAQWFGRAAGSTGDPFGELVPGGVRRAPSGERLASPGGLLRREERLMPEKDESEDGALETTVSPVGTTSTAPAAATTAATTATASGAAGASSTNSTATSAAPAGTSKEPEATTSEAEKETTGSTTSESPKLQFPLKALTTRPPATTATTTQKKTTTELFNCADGFVNWKLGWSAAKKEWCCRFKSRGCAPTARTPVNASGASEPCTTAACHERVSAQQSQGAITGEQICEGHAFSEQACMSIGCCFFDRPTRLCYSAVANRACLSAKEAAVRAAWWASQQRAAVAAAHAGAHGAPRPVVIQPPVPIVVRAPLQAPRPVVVRSSVAVPAASTTTELPDLLKDGMTRADKKAVKAGAKAGVDEANKEARKEIKELKEAKKEQDIKVTPMLMLIVGLSSLLSFVAVASCVGLVVWYCWLRDLWSQNQNRPAYPEPPPAAAAPAPAPQPPQQTAGNL